MSGNIYEPMGAIMRDMVAIWKDSTNQAQGFKYRSIDGYPDYIVTDAGVVISLNYANSGAPKALKPRLVNGYSLVTLCRHGAKKQISVHRLVAIAFLGQPPDGNVVNHLNGDKRDNRVGNIEWTTPRQNSIHAYQTGLHIISEKHRASAAILGRKKRKLTMEDAEAIRASFRHGEITITELARQSGMSRSGIGKIIRNHSYVEAQ